MSDQILHHLSFADYRRLDGLSISTLKEMSRSPMRFRHRLENQYESAAMHLGTATHTAVLEPHKLMTEYVMWDGGARRGKAWEHFSETHCDRKILTVDEFNLAQAMRDSVRSSPPAMRYLARGEAEVTMTWENPINGIRGRGRIDWLTNDGGRPVIVGLKTAKDCRHFQFAKQAYALGYHLQWAYYYDAFHTITGEFAKVVEVVVENTAPHEPAVYEITGDILALGHDEYMRLLDVYQQCESTNTWPPIHADEEVLTLPSYAYGQEDDDLSELGITA